MWSKKGKNISTGIFWYWNITPDPAGIREQLKHIASAGFSCVYIHPMPDNFRRNDFFSGRIYLESTVLSDKDESVYIQFENIDHSASLEVNGICCGDAVCSPFIFKSDLKKGENKLVLRVSSSAGNEFRRCFEQELEPAGYFNTYAARFRQYTIDDDKCGISKQVFIYTTK